MHNIIYILLNFKRFGINLNYIFLNITGLLWKFIYIILIYKYILEN